MWPRSAIFYFRSIDLINYLKLREEITLGVLNGEAEGILFSGWIAYFFSIFQFFTCLYSCRISYKCIFYHTSAKRAGSLFKIPQIFSTEMQMGLFVLCIVQYGLTNVDRNFNFSVSFLQKGGRVACYHYPIQGRLFLLWI